MAYSYQITVVSSTSPGPFYFTDIDGYLDISHIKVYVNGILQTTGYTINQSTKSVTFAASQDVSSVIRIERQTPKTVAGRVTDFNDGSVLTAQDLDNAALQNLYISQEAQDAGVNALPLTGDGLQWDASNKRITNLAYPIDPSDAVTKRYIDGYSLSGEAWTVPQSWSFTGNGTQTVFAWLTGGGPVPATTDSAMFIVEAGGVIQRPEIDYTINAANITFLSVPANGVGIRIRNFGVSRDIPVWGNPITFSGNVTVSGTATLKDVAIDTDIGIGRGGLGDSNSVYVGEVPTSGSAINNTGVGANIFTQLTGGADNVAMGTNAAQGNTSGTRNTNIGYNCVGNPGSHNTAVGANAGNGVSSVTTNQSVYIGSAATASGNVTNEIVIGYNATGDGSNTAVIGNASTTQTKTRGNLISTGAITSTSGNITASNGNLVASNLLTVSGTGTSSIAGTLSVPQITGLTSLSAANLSGTAVTGGTITATTSLTVGSSTLSAPSGTAPMFAPRAWANFCSSIISTESNRTELTGTWVVESANVLVMNIPNHGFAVNHVFRGILTGGYSDTLHFTVTTVVNTGQIKVTARVPDTVGNVNFPVTTPATGGNIAGIWKATIRSSGNVSSIVVMDNNLGRFAVNFTSPLPNANYSFIGTASNGNGTANTGAVANATLFEANRANGAAIEFSRKTVNCLEFWSSTANPHSANFVVFA